MDKTWTRMTGLALVFVAAASALAKEPTTRPPATNPAAAGAPTTQPANGKAPPPTTQPSPAKPEPPRPKFHFRFADTPLREVVRRFAQLNEKPLIGDLNIEGNLTFFDSVPYAYDDALDMLNLFLRQRGYNLTEWKRYLRLQRIEGVGQTVETYPDLAETEGVRSGRIVQVVVPLRFVDSDTAAKSVLRMVSPFGAIQPLPKGSGLVVMDSLENIKRIRRVLDILDTEQLVDQQLKTYTLKHASAKSMSDVLSKLFPGTGARRRWNREARRMETIAGKGSVWTTYDERTNTLFLSGSAQQIVLADQMIERLDVEKTLDSSDLRLFELKKARAEELARTISQAFPRPPRRRNQPRPPAEVTVVPDATTNQLLVSAPVDRMPQIEKLINDLDEAVGPSSGIRIFRLKFADAQQLSGVISAASGTRRDSRGRRTSGLNVTVDRKSVV